MLTLCIIYGIMWHMTKKTKETAAIKDVDLKEFSITIENMVVGKELKLCLIVRYLNPETQKYVMFESKIPKTSVLGKEVVSVIKDVKKLLKEQKKVSKK